MLHFARFIKFCAQLARQIFCSLLNARNIRKFTYHRSRASAFAGVGPLDRNYLLSRGGTRSPVLLGIECSLLICESVKILALRVLV